MGFFLPQPGGLESFLALSHILNPDHRVSTEGPDLEVAHLHRGTAPLTGGLLVHCDHDAIPSAHELLAFDDGVVPTLQKSPRVSPNLPRATICAGVRELWPQ